MFEGLNDKILKAFKCKKFSRKYPVVLIKQTTVKFTAFVKDTHTEHKTIFCRK